MSGSKRFQGVEKGSTAYKLLAKMGWEEGKGLGAKGQGITQHVKVHKKADASGVGAAQAAAKARDWTVGMMAYDQVLAALKGVSAKGVSGKGELVSHLPSDRVATENADTQAIQGKPEANGAAATDAHKKKTRKVKSAESVAAATVRSKKQKRVPELAGALAQPVTQQAKQGAEEQLQRQPRAARHAGRFKKREKGKHVLGYSSTDLAAILGAGPSTDSLSEQAQTEAGQPMLVMVEEPNELLGAVAGSSGSDEAETERLWWHGHFVQAGRGGSGYSAFASNKEKMSIQALKKYLPHFSTFLLEGCMHIIADGFTSRAQPSKIEVNVNGFSETDQANLWHMLTDDQSKAKQGLGQSSVLKKVAGARWEGTRTTICSDEDSDVEIGEAATPSQQEEAPVLSHIMVPAKRSSRQAAQAEHKTDEGWQFGGNSQKGAKPSSLAASGPLPTEPSGSAMEEEMERGASEAAARKLPKPKKLARQVLAATARKSLPLKAFKAELWGVAQTYVAKDRKAYVRRALIVLSDSKQFLVTKKAISLVD